MGSQNANSDSPGRIHHFYRTAGNTSILNDICAAYLTMHCQTTDDIHMAAVFLNPADGIRPETAAVWPAGASTDKLLHKTADRAIKSQKGMVVRLQIAHEGGIERLPRYCIAVPVRVSGRIRGAVALNLDVQDPSQLEAIKKDLHQSTAWLEGLMARREIFCADRRTPEGAAQGPEGQDLPARRYKLVYELLAAMHAQAHIQSAATAFVTELAIRLKCDRVSLGFVRNHRVRLHAVSHTAHFERKTNLVRAIEAAMDEALDQACIINMPETAEARSAGFRITHQHEALSKGHGSEVVCSLPLMVNDAMAGVLTVEGPDAGNWNAEKTALCEAALSVAGPYLHYRRRDERMLMAKAAESWKGHLARLLGPGHPGLKLAALGALVLALTACFMTSPFRISAKTILEGSIQRAAVAPFEGYINEANFRAGDMVKQGDCLCRLDQRDLRLTLLKWRSQEEQLVKQYQQAVAKREAAQARIITAQIMQTRAQITLVNDQLARSEVTAPLDGIVVAGDLSQSIGAPVERGDVLFEIAPLDGYRIVLNVDERDVAAIKAGQAGSLLLSSFPGEPLPFTVQKITPVSEAREGRNLFRVEAALDAKPDMRLRPGMEGIGKIEAGRRSLLRIWTQPAINWFRMAMWKWLP